MSARVFQSEGFEDSGFFIRARIMLDESTPATVAGISSIDLTVTDLSDDTEVLAASVTPADVLFDTYQTWSRDDTGYNFKYAAPASSVPNADRRYRFEFKFTPASGEAFHLSHERKTGDLKRS